MCKEQQLKLYFVVSVGCYYRPPDYEPGQNDDLKQGKPQKILYSVLATEIIQIVEQQRMHGDLIYVFFCSPTRRL